MFTSMVVALDLQTDGDRALPVVRALSGLGALDVELLTVSAPLMAEKIDHFELSRRATANGWPAHSYAVVHGNDVAQAIADRVKDREDALLVMATSAKRPLFGHLLGSVSEAVLRMVDQPVLLIGPHVAPELHWQRPTPILCVDPVTPAADAVDAVTRWTRTFPSAPPWIAQVIPTAATEDARTEAAESSRARRIADLLAHERIDARWTVVHGGEPEVWLEDFADRVPEPVFVTTSTRWTSGRHWHSTTRQLVQHSTRPVLVVPARPTRAVRQQPVVDPAARRRQDLRHWTVRSGTGTVV